MFTPLFSTRDTTKRYKDAIVHAINIHNIPAVKGFIFTVCVEFITLRLIVSLFKEEIIFVDGDKYVMVRAHPIKKMIVRIK